MLGDEQAIGEPSDVSKLVDADSKLDDDGMSNKVMLKLAIAQFGHYQEQLIELLDSVESLFRQAV